MVPPALWQHLGQRFDVVAPHFAALRARYWRRRTLYSHQDLTPETLRFQWLSAAQRHALMRVLRDEPLRRVNLDENRATIRMRSLPPVDLSRWEASRA